MRVSLIELNDVSLHCVVWSQVARSIRQRRPDVTMQLVSREVVDSSGMVLRELKDRVEKVPLLNMQHALIVAC